MQPGREPMTVVDFPDQLRNDIFYCQRALKEHIKIHQFCAVQHAVRPSKQYQSIIQAIEREIEGIGRDQQKVIAKMRQHLQGIHQKLQEDQGTNNTEEMDNNIIRSYLDMHRPSLGGLALQASGLVQSRATEKELIRNYGLLTELQRFMRPTAVIERVPFSPTKRLSTRDNTSQLTESRRKFLDALKNTKPQYLRETDSDEDDDIEGVQFLEEDLYYAPPKSKLPASPSKFFNSIAGVGIEGVKEIRSGDVAEPKRMRGRPRKPKLCLLNGNSAPSTRANSPEVVTMPYVDLPLEVEETNNYDQPGFMQRLGLYTQELARYLRTRRPERRRRTVQSTEKTDYHYGHIETSPMVRDRVAVLAKKKLTKQYLSPRVFKKRRTFERSASSSPPNVKCTCKNGDRDSPCRKCSRRSP